MKEEIGLPGQSDLKSGLTKSAKPVMIMNGEMYTWGFLFPLPTAYLWAERPLLPYGGNSICASHRCHKKVEAGVLRSKKEKEHVECYSKTHGV